MREHIGAMSPTAEQEIRTTTSAVSEAVFSPIQSENNLIQILF
jgi:16S rRNA G966 N2-methylase RsmD